LVLMMLFPFNEKVVDVCLCGLKPRESAQVSLPGQCNIGFPVPSANKFRYRRYGESA